MEEDLPAGVAEDPQGGAENFNAGTGAEGAVGEKDELRGELLESEVGEGFGRVGGFGGESGESGESGEDLGARVDAAGRAELSEVVGEKKFEGVGVLACNGGKELALERFEVSSEGRDGGGGDADSLSLGSPGS